MSIARINILTLIPILALTACGGGGGGDALANELARMALSILRHKNAFDAQRDEVAIGV